MAGAVTGCSTPNEQADAHTEQPAPAVATVASDVKPQPVSTNSVATPSAPVTPKAETEIPIYQVPSQKEDGLGVNGLGGAFRKRF